MLWTLVQIFVEGLSFELCRTIEHNTELGADRVVYQIPYTLSS
jgi:hypothetical protein